MALTLRVDYADGQNKEVEIKLIDQVRFEARFEKSWSNALQDISNTELLWVTWTACTRLNQTALDFEPWVEAVEDISVVRVKKSKPSETPAVPPGS